MTTDLFPAAHMPSPKLAWLAEHGLTTRDGGQGWWYCERASDGRHWAGRTEHAAIVSFCIKTKEPHWNKWNAFVS